MGMEMGIGPQEHLGIIDKTFKNVSNYESTKNS